MSRTPPEEGPLGESARKFERAIARSPPATVVLKLYVSGLTPRSRRAISNLRSLCETFIPQRYDLEIIDIYQQPGLAKEVQIIAVPTLIKSLPPPLRRVIGDLGDAKRLLAALGLSEGEEGLA